MVEEKGAPPGKNGLFFLSFTVFTADMLEKMGRPPGKNDKHITCLIFTVFTADMLEEKGRPPR